MHHKIFRIIDPSDYKFARTGRKGTWEKGENGESTRISPLIIEWLPGSDMIGDFTWPGYGFDVVIAEDAARILKQEFSGFELGPVEMYQEKTMPKRITKRTKSRVWLPYGGPMLFDLKVTRWVNLDKIRSSVHRGESGHLEVEGHERFVSEWDKELRELKHFHYKRLKGKGVYIERDKLGCEGFFKIVELPAWIFCTQNVKIFIEENKFTNIRFLEMGEFF